MAKSRKRPSLSKSTRFEVFKRDSFSCQYCGKRSPDVVLHVDHIRPVSDGGSSDLMNLITSCQECNLGKGCKKLSDSSAVSRRMNQASELQARREQIEMVAKWQRGLSELEDLQYKEACSFFASLSGGWGVDSPVVGPQIRTYISKHGLSEVMSSMRSALAQCLRRDSSGKTTRDSVEIACTVMLNRLKYRDANLKDPVGCGARYAAGMARNSLPWVPQDHRQVFVNWAKSGVPVDILKELALRSCDWGDIVKAVEDFAKGIPNGR